MSRFSGLRVWARRLQSDFVLPAARTFYLIGACLALAIVVLGIVAALYFQFGVWRSPSVSPLPPEYQSRGIAITMQAIDEHLSAPSHVQFTVVRQIDRPLNGGEFLGYFTAASANGLALYPNDFEIIGGTHGAMFQRAIERGSSGLRPGPELVKQINATLPTVTVLKGFTYRVRVIAHDRYGNRSGPEDISFTLYVGPPSVAATPQLQLPVPEGETTEAATPLQALAREIAHVVDPARTPAYFDAYKAAMNVPKRCGSFDTPVFVDNYRRAFDHARPRLSPHNIEGFYVGVCDAWAAAVQADRSSRAAADARRALTIAENDSARMRVELEKIGASTLRNLALGVVGVALLVFLTIALLLAFLAMEGHSRAMRQAVEVLAEQSTRGGLQ